ncbi:carboxyl-terminal-processing peptidase 1, chloroplastic-like isoform X2 [Iris pallida]|uniref:Carboxyl-terminal-processing peptidase 1, chloroplastic-like isoform X2 n=1 Tax=Iris pallida TaxID=29817 RepID=A0AAX6GPL4_IRIPA|nr:carboxyl-terminal-processing peptidase 1, chloroplastic-like isoform X2 [Iris pallida]
MLHLQGSNHHQLFFQPLHLLINLSKIRHRRSSSTFTDNASAVSDMTYKILPDWAMVVSTPSSSSSAPSSPSSASTGPKGGCSSQPQPEAATARRSASN